MTENQIRGLHICRPGNAPNVGQVKCFNVAEVQGRSGNTYTKIRAGKTEEGDLYYMIMSVAKTDYSDAHGNVSYNVELERAATPAQPQVQQVLQNAPQASGNGPVTRPEAPTGQFDTPRQHLMRAANLYCLCIDAVDTVIAAKYRAKNIDLHEHSELRQAAVSTLFIDAQRAGYVQHMPDKEQKQKDPF